VGSDYIVETFRILGFQLQTSVSQGLACFLEDFLFGFRLFESVTPPSLTAAVHRGWRTVHSCARGELHLAVVPPPQENLPGHHNVNVDVAGEAS